MMLQLQDIYTAFAGPVKVRVVGVWQLFLGTMISTRSPAPGVIVPADGLKVIFDTPLLDDFQVRLRVFELLLIDAVHIQAARFELKVQSLSALKLPEPGETSIIFGPGSTVSVTYTITWFEPILNRILPPYVPAASCVFRLDALMVTLWVAPAMSPALVGATLSQFTLLFVDMTVDHDPTIPQLLTISVCT